MTWGGFWEKGRSEGTRVEGGGGQMGCGKINEFGLRGLILYWKIGAVDIYLAGARARWELEDVGERDPGFSKG